MEGQDGAGCGRLRQDEAWWRSGRTGWRGVAQGVAGLDGTVKGSSERDEMGWEDAVWGGAC